jgi:nitrogen fixation protein
MPPTGAITDHGDGALPAASHLCPSAHIPVRDVSEGIIHVAQRVWWGSANERLKGKSIEGWNVREPSYDRIYLTGIIFLLD